MDKMIQTIDKNKLHTIQVDKHLVINYLILPLNESDFSITAAKR